jgi:hypothetical protein
MLGAGVENSRPSGRALIVGQPAYRPAPLQSLQRRGYSCTEVDDPYEAMVYLCKRPLFYSTLILSLNSLYREELTIIASIKRRFSHVDVWLSDTDGRQAALAEAMRQGADGLFAEDGLHRIAGGVTAAASLQAPLAEPALEFPKHQTGAAGEKSPPEAEKSADPLLTAEELRALLHESPGAGPV